MPEKPYPEFPLYCHATGQWAKKIRGKVHYFGKDANKALVLYREQAGDLHAGRPARPAANAVTVAYLCNHFLTSGRQLVDRGELALESWAAYHPICAMLAEKLGRVAV